MSDRKNTNELVLSDGEYAYTQDTTSGIIKIHTGPLVINIPGQDIPVVYNSETSRFERVSLHDAVKHHPIAPQGYYCVLWNPAEDERHPEDKSKAVAPALQIGQRVNIPGPCTFALWPRQSAKVIEGHHLRSNQYLLVRIYDEEAARSNWSSAIVKPATGPAAEDERGEGVVVEVAGDVPEDLSVGRQIIIRGTEVSFYVPPTGVEVVEAEGRYVRDALTLERLEYSILVDEDGNKRYERGPAVVFPRPTEHFYFEERDHGERSRVFRPIELNPIQGIHVKVIADYTDELTGRSYSEGEELFITGEDTPIYFPRQEHSLISYDGRSKHFATAVPAGEARYVMQRKTGEIRMVAGPTMLLPNPCDEVIVRRALTEQECALWYPSNTEALEYNRKLRQLATRAPTTRSGAVSEGQVQRSKRRGGGRKGMRKEKGAVMEASHTSSDVALIAADEFSRGSTFNEPRTLTLMTRFAGVPTINVWTDYAVMLVSRKTGARRVEQGPMTALLAYDETLEVLKLSTGTPKDNRQVLETVYLKVRNNRVSHVVSARTSDHVPVRLKLALRVNFEGDDPSRWFALEDYVGYLCDHVQSVLKAQVRGLTVEAFAERASGLVRDALLGAPDERGERPGTAFAENGMRLFDLDLLEVEVQDATIASLLSQARQQMVRSNIELAAAQRKLEAERRLESLVRERASIEAETASHQARLEREQIERELTLNLERLTAATREHSERLAAQQAKDAVADAGHEASLERKRKNAEFERGVEEALQHLRVALISAETQATVQRLGAVQEGFSEALLALGNQETLVKVADALSVQQLLGGRNLPEVVTRVFENTPLDTVMRTVQERAAVVHTNGQSGRVTTVSDS
ncbi:MAG: hypothetical protein CMH57_15970 [Myxococcales bacterium]|nr:hypothetical protein [Myxococcales bacterium]